MTIIHLGPTTVTLEPTLVTTTLPDGTQVFGAPHETDDYRRTAADHGYGDDVARMNRCHELAHSMLAHWLGLPCSPTLNRVGHGQHEPTLITAFEEAAVQSIERFANEIGVDLVAIAVANSGLSA